LRVGSMTSLERTRYCISCRSVQPAYIEVEGDTISVTCDTCATLFVFPRFRVLSHALRSPKQSVLSGMWAHIALYRTQGYRRPRVVRNLRRVQDDRAKSAYRRPVGRASISDVRNRTVGTVSNFWVDRT
jgi:hypothetical protein